MKSLLISMLIISCSLTADEWKAEDNAASLIRSVTGFTEPSAYLDIKAEYPGRIEEFKLQESQELKGDKNKVLLITQDSRLAAIELERAKAAHKSEEQKLEKNLSEKKVQERAVKYRLLEFKRLQTLAKDGKVTKSSFDQAQFEYDSAQLKIKDIESALLVQNQVIAERKVAVDKAAEDLSRYKIYGPRGWVLNERLAEPGSWVMAGEKICRLVDVRHLSVFFRLNEEEIESIRNKGIKMNLKRKQKPVKAVLHRVDLEFDPISRKRLIEFRIEAGELPEAAGGIELELMIEVPFPEPAVKIPMKYIFKKYDQIYVRSKKGDDIALIPLRKTDDAVIINKSVLPDGLTLVKPADKK